MASIYEQQSDQSAASYHSNIGQRMLSLLRQFLSNFGRLSDGMKCVLERDGATGMGRLG